MHPQSLIEFYLFLEDMSLKSLLIHRLPRRLVKTGDTEHICMSMEMVRQKEREGGLRREV